jgi:hypothetical protein
MTIMRIYKKSYIVPSLAHKLSSIREQVPPVEMECYAKPLEIDKLINKINEELDSPSS